VWNGVESDHGLEIVETWEDVEDFGDRLGWPVGMIFGNLGNQREWGVREVPTLARFAVGTWGTEQYAHRVVQFEFLILS
jgi:hypothetical protein